MKREILGCLTEKDWTLLLDNSYQVSYRKGEMILAEGAKTQAIFILERGYASIESSDRGSGIRLNQIGPGEIFGEVSFLEEQGASASVIAEEDAEVKIIDEVQLQSLLSSVPGLATRFYQSLALTLAQRLRRLSDRVAASNLQTMEAVPGYQVPPIPRDLQVPDSLVAALDRFRSQLLQVESQLKEEKLSPVQGRDRVGKTCDLMLAEFAKHLEDDLLAFGDRAELEASISDYVFREAFPLLMRSATIVSCHSRGRSYPNDYLIGKTVEENEPSGDGLLGSYIDAWFLSRPFCRSHRQGRRLLGGKIASVAQSRSLMVRIASLVSGNARELFGLLKIHKSRFYATCIDSSSEALVFNARRSQELGLTDRMNVLQGQICSLIAGEDRLALPPQHIIYALDLCDRLSDHQVVALLDWTYDRLADGGTALFTNFQPNFPDRLLLKHVFNWQQYYRTEADWRSLLDSSQFGSAAVEFQTEATGWMLLAIASKQYRQ